MQRLLLLSLLILAVFACKETKPSKNPESEKQSILDAWEKSIEENEFSRVCQAIPPLKDSDTITLPGGQKKELRSMLRSQGPNVLGVVLGNGFTFWMKDSLHPGDGKPVIDFMFETWLPRTAQYQVAVSYPNDFETWLVDYRNGKVIKAEGLLCESPDSTQLFAFNSDLDYYLTPNGFQHYIATDTGIVLKKTWNHLKYAPMLACWDSDSTVVVKAVLADEVHFNAAEDMHPKFFRISVPQMPDRNDIP